MANSARKPKVVSIGFSVPPHRYTQEEVFSQLGYPRRYWRIFRESGINHRHFWVPLERIAGLNFQEQQEEYLRGAVALSLEAAHGCLDGRQAAEIGCVTYASCTGFAPGPVIPHYLSRQLSLSPDVYHCNISSMGCEGGYPGLKRAVDFTISTGRPSLVIACELSSCAFFPELEERPARANDMELLRSNAVFADGASAVLVGYDDDWRHPAIVDTETYTDTSYLGELGFIWQEGRLRVRLGRRVPEIASCVVEQAAQALLNRHGLRARDIQWFIIHAAGNAVIDRIRDALSIPEEKTLLSRETLRHYGNTSSTSVGITGKRLMAESVQPGDYVLMLSVGPGMTGGATLLRFEQQSSEKG